MEQPRLGRKISELRKAKGLTQSELVEQCDITIRTLQRIESGDVTPRSYTVKNIFNVLEYNYFDSNERKMNQEDMTIKKERKWSEKVLKHIGGLFDFKENAIRNSIILSVLCVIFVFACFTVYYKVTVTQRLHKKLIGTWQICNRDSTVSTNVGGRENIIRYKVISTNSFMVSSIDKEQKRVQASFYGTYTLEKDIYTEFIQYTDQGWRNLFADKNAFEIKIEKDLLFIDGVNNPYKEIWKKVEY